MKPETHPNNTQFPSLQKQKQTYRISYKAQPVNNRCHCENHITHTHTHTVSTVRQWRIYSKHCAFKMLGVK
jgi:hypothetical protein